MRYESYTSPFISSSPLAFPHLHYKIPPLLESTTPEIHICDATTSSILNL